MIDNKSKSKNKSSADINSNSSKQSTQTLTNKGVDVKETEKEKEKEDVITILHPSVLKKRLEMFLKVFAAVISPKQLYLHTQLFDYYNSILARSETNIVKLAYDCILGYKPAYLMPVRENIRRLLDDKKMRDELVVFDPSVGAVGGGGFAGVVSGSSAAVDEGQLGVRILSICLLSLLSTLLSSLISFIHPMKTVGSV